MIRFDCPGCGKEFRIAPDKAGKSARCNACGNGFVIPAAEQPAEPETVAVDPCPKCLTAMSVAPTDVGKEVACPYCRAVFTAVEGGVLKMAPPPPATPQADRPGRRMLQDNDDRNLRRRRDEDEDDEYDEYDDRPRRRRRRDREECKKLAAGILALMLGMFGAHKFYLGYTTAGMIQFGLLLLTCGASTFVAVTEAVLYLAKSDDDFVETYQVGRREWF